MLTNLHRLPDGFLETDAAGLHRVLPGPALIHLPGRRAPPPFVSILLHGNEHAGLAAIQQVLTRYRGRDACARHFRVRDGWVEFRRGAMPPMLTLNTDVIRQDCLGCLGYLMERHRCPADALQDKLPACALP